MTKRFAALSWVGGPTGGGWSNPIAVATDYAIILAIQVTVTGSPTGGAFLSPGYSFDGSTWYNMNAIGVGFSNGTYGFNVEMPDSAQLVRLFHQPQTGGGQSSIAAQMGSLLP